jgi:hypothetical protein
MQIGSLGSYVSAFTTARSAGVASPAGDGDFASALATVASAGTSSVGGAVPDEDRYAPRPGQDLSYLTPDDRRMIKAATGYVISSDGVVQNPTPGQVVDPFIAVLASDRVQGNVSGSSVTPDYLRQVFAKYGNNLQNANMAFNPAYLDRALDYLAQTEKDRSDGTSRSSFSVGA